VKAADVAICEALSSRSALTPKLLRAGLITRARIEVAGGKKDAAILSYEEARLANPDEPLQGFNLKDAFKACLDKEDDALLIETVKNWKSMERLAWMTWNFEDSAWLDFEELRRAASRAGQQEYLYQAYDEVIKLLDNVDAAAPIRYQLAGTHFVVSLNMEPAKALMNDTLDTSSSGYPYALTNEDPAYTLVCAVVLMTEIIYHQFRTTSDSAVKAQLYTEIKSLTTRPMAQSIAPLKSELMYHSLTMARMARKMAPAREFQTILESTFNGCYDALIDNVGWNDYQNLNTLAAVVSCLDGMEKEAQILVSAQFSKLDPAIKNELSDSDSEDGDQKAKGVEGTENGDGEDNDEDSEDGDNENAGQEEEEDPLPTDEGDLADVFISCNGECKPITTWEAWKNRPLYACITCCNTCLCEPCYHKRQEYNRNGGDVACRDKVGSVYCGMNHTYIRGPIPGWKGIKDGVMTIEGQDGEVMVEVKFKEWLEELKNVKWKLAWERFWLKED
jgi:hypothetical protein